MTAASDQALPTFPIVQLLYHSASCLASDRGFQLDGRYNLSELAAVFKIAVRIDNLVECKNSVDDWL
jgi:hypothetical protein